MMEYLAEDEEFDRIAISQLRYEARIRRAEEAAKRARMDTIVLAIVVVALLLILVTKL